VKVIGVETVRSAIQPNLLFLRLHTDDGITGLGESFFGAAAVEAYIHETAAPALLAGGSTAPEAVAHQLRSYVGFQGAGAETRGNSAIDLALWDVLGKRAGLPLGMLAGGPVRDRMPVYNTCAGSSYIRAASRQSSDNWGVGGADDQAGYEDLTAFLTEPEALAEDLLAGGVSAMKIWPFDRAAERTCGTDISRQELADGIDIVARIRTAVGNRMDVMVELHGLWQRPAATRIIRALEPYNPYWVEDPLRPDAVDGLAALRRETSVPIAAGETLVGRRGFLPLLRDAALDIVTVDVQWCGGFTEARKIAAMADAHALPIAPHDCTGPVTLAACTHLVTSQPNGLIQETTRAFIHSWYPLLTTGFPAVEDGTITASTSPGHGVRIRDEVLTDPSTTRRLTGQST
jgi:L-alanine-DL-glutamate epimerase-like enolase superfamily enzyme